MIKILLKAMLSTLFGIVILGFGMGIGVWLSGVNEEIRSEAAKLSKNAITEGRHWLKRKGRQILESPADTPKDREQENASLSVDIDADESIPEEDSETVAEVEESLSVAETEIRLHTFRSLDGLLEGVNLENQHSDFVLFLPSIIIALVLVGVGSLLLLKTSKT